MFLTGRKCTFGKKCKYFHPESSTAYKSVTDRLKEKSEKNKEPSNMAKSLANEVYQTTSGPNSLINEDQFNDSVSFIEKFTKQYTIVIKTK